MSKTANAANGRVALELVTIDNNACTLLSDVKPPSSRTIEDGMSHRPPPAFGVCLLLGSVIAFSACGGGSLPTSPAPIAIADPNTPVVTDPPVGGFPDPPPPVPTTPPV